MLDICYVTSIRSQNVLSSFTFYLKDTHFETNIDECTSDPCQNDGVCTDDVNCYTCSCADGYEGMFFSQRILLNVYIKRRLFSLYFTNIFVLISDR